MKFAKQRTAIAFVTTAAALLLPAAADAATATATVTVNATVNQTCSMTKITDVDFLTVNVLATASLTATGQVRLTCNKGATPVVTTNATGSMTNGTDTLAYQLRVPTLTGGGPNFTTCPAFGTGTSWLSGGGSLTATSAYAASGGPSNISVCAEMSTPQLGASAGTYLETVTVTATYP